MCFLGKKLPPNFPLRNQKKKRWKNRFPKWDFFSSQVEQRHLGTHVGATTGCQGGWQCWHHGLTSQWRFGNDHRKTSENGCFFTICLRYFFPFVYLWTTVGQKICYTCYTVTRIQRQRASYEAAETTLHFSTLHLDSLDHKKWKETCAQSAW